MIVFAYVYMNDEVYVVYSDSINEVIKKYINLVEKRKFGENDMIVLHENQAEFVKWLGE